MKDEIGYDPTENFVSGLKSFFTYHGKNVSRIVMYISIMSTTVFHVNIFGFFYKTPESITISFWLNVAIIVVPTTIHLLLERRKKLQQDIAYRRIMSSGYLFLIALIICTEIVFFTIHWIHDAAHEYEIEFPTYVSNQITMAMILALFWLPMSEAIGFNLRELRDWVCGRNKHLTEFESKNSISNS